MSLVIWTDEIMPHEGTEQTEVVKCSEIQIHNTQEELKDVICNSNLYLRTNANRPCKMFPLTYIAAFETEFNQSNVRLVHYKMWGG